MYVELEPETFAKKIAEETKASFETLSDVSQRIRISRLQAELCGYEVCLSKYGEHTIQWSACMNKIDALKNRLSELRSLQSSIKCQS